MLTPVFLVLVCLLPAPRDLEIARLLGNTDFQAQFRLRESPGAA
ncbi:MAG: hypothetical protein AB1531_03225 [Chloroflexota bacterium]